MVRPGIEMKSRGRQSGLTHPFRAARERNGKRTMGEELLDDVEMSIFDGLDQGGVAGVV